MRLQDLTFLEVQLQRYVFVEQLLVLLRFLRVEKADLQRLLPVQEQLLRSKELHVDVEGKLAVLHLHLTFSARVQDLEEKAPRAGIWLAVIVALSRQDCLHVDLKLNNDR